MRWISPVFAVLMIASASTTTTAGLFNVCGSNKSCECAETCQPHLCCPTIARPQHVNIYTYQRKCSDLGLPCQGCSAETNCCAPQFCAPLCAAPDQLNVCHPSGGCTPCCVAPDSCIPVCAAPSGTPGCCVQEACQTGAFCEPDGCGQSCCSRTDNECRCFHAGGCHSREACRDIAELIYESMTACYASDRRNAIHRLGDHFDCCCHPEVMNAFVYALNDSDERVRSKAADEIGDQIRRNRCIVGSPVICALTHALADCDRSVRRQAEEALELSGYRIVDGCCQAPICLDDTGVWSGSKSIVGSNSLDSQITDDLDGDLLPSSPDFSGNPLPVLATEEEVQPAAVQPSIRELSPSAPADHAKDQGAPASETPPVDFPPAPTPDSQTYHPNPSQQKPFDRTPSRLASLLGLTR